MKKSFDLMTGEYYNGNRTTAKLVFDIIIENVKKSGNDKNHPYLLASILFSNYMDNSKEEINPEKFQRLIDNLGLGIKIKKESLNRVIGFFKNYVNQKQEKIEEKKKIKELEEKLKKDIDKLEKQKKNLQEKISELNKEKENIQKKIDELRSKLNQQKNSETQIQGKMNSLEQKREEENKIFMNDLRPKYETSRIDKNDVLKAASDIFVADKVSTNYTKIFSDMVQTVTMGNISASNTNALLGLEIMGWTEAKNFNSENVDLLKKGFNCCFNITNAGIEFRENKNRLNESRNKRTMIEKDIETNENRKSKVSQYLTKSNDDLKLLEQQLTLTKEELNRLEYPKQQTQQKE